jgi:hypothetical protein
LGDYCRQLWLNWPDSKTQLAKEIDWHYLVASGAAESRRLWPEVSIDSFDQSAAGLLAALQANGADTILLQYVGYAYDSGGKPFWLVDALKSWCAAKGGRRLFVMFHETWASGLPWQRAFWQRAGQRRCAANLLSLSTKAVTSNEATFADLKSLGLTNELLIIPLGSSFTSMQPAPRCWRSLLIFGKEQSRLRAVKQHSELIMKLCQSGLIDRIVLSGGSATPANDAGQQLISSWRLPLELACTFNFQSEQIPPEITSAGLSLMHTQSTCLLKSTSFHLAARIGQVPIALQELEPGCQVISGRHYLGYRKGQLNQILSELRRPELLESISQRLAVLSATSLSWPTIAQSWSKLLTGIEPA